MARRKQKIPARIAKAVIKARGGESYRSYKEKLGVSTSHLWQVEHGITELMTGLDVVGIMIDVAMGKQLPIKQEDVKQNRWALEVRLNAEDPKTFSPSFGDITRLLVPQGQAVPEPAQKTGQWQTHPAPRRADVVCLADQGGVGTSVDMQTHLPPPVFRRPAQELPGRCYGAEKKGTP